MVTDDQIREDLLAEGIDTKDNNVKVLHFINDTINRVDAIAILTEWEEFKKVDWNRRNEMIFDGRNMLKRKESFCRYESL